VEQEAVDDGHGVVVGDDTADGLDLLGKQLAVDDELHIFVSFNFLFIDLFTKCKNNNYFSNKHSLAVFFINNLLLHGFAPCRRRWTVLYLAQLH
jgi:hypothetical protein